MRRERIARREYYSIGEVCEMAGLKPHVLRYWETQFRELNPSKNRAGNRVYRAREIKLIELVKICSTRKSTQSTARARNSSNCGPRGSWTRRPDRRSIDRPCAVCTRASSDSSRSGRTARRLSGGAAVTSIDSQPIAPREALDISYTAAPGDGTGAVPSRQQGDAAEKRILCTNDDGYLAPGLDLLRRVASGLGDVTVVAPDREQSATSHSLTLHRPLRVKPSQQNIYHVDGTPTDCVLLALGGAVLDRAPDLVLSGVNHGPNLGEDVLYSGLWPQPWKQPCWGSRPQLCPSLPTSSSHRGKSTSRCWSAAGPTGQRDRYPRDTAEHQHPAHPAGRDSRHPRNHPRAPRLCRVADAERGPYGRDYYWIGGGEASGAGVRRLTSERWLPAISR